MGKKTKWIIFTIAVMWGMTIVLRSQQTENKQNWAERGIRLREVEIKAKRPMKDIGVQKTVFDSLVLKENIALSMADVLTFNSSILLHRRCFSVAWHFICQYGGRWFRWFGTTFYYTCRSTRIWYAICSGSWFLSDV